MATLLEQLGSLTSGGSLSVDLAGAAGQFADIGNTLRGVMSEPPGDFTALLGQLDALPLPQLDLAGDLTAGLAGLVPQLQGALGGGADPIGGALAGLGAQVKEGLAGALTPLLAAVDAIRTLLATDLSCGLVPVLAPPAVTPVLPAPAPGDPPAPPPAPVPAPAPVLSAAQVDAAKTILDSLPPDMTAPALLKWLHARIGTHRPGYFYFRSIPVVDDLRDPLDTLVRWDAASPDALAAEFVATFTLLADLVTRAAPGSFAAALPAPTIAALPAAALGTASQGLLAALAEVDAAVRANDAGAIAGALAAAQTALTALQTQNTAVDALAAALSALREAVRNLPGALETGICRLTVLLSPRAAFGDLTSAIGPVVPQDVLGDAFEPITRALTGARQMLERLLEALDVGAVTAPIAGVLGQAEGAIETVNAGIAQLTAGARAAFADVDAALAVFDPAAIVAQARAAIEQAVQAIAGGIAAALAPAAGALTGALNGAQGALGSFDPEALAAPMQAVLTEISNLLQGPEVQALLNALAQLKQLAQQLDALSFAPVGDVVIGGIGTVKSALDSIDDANLAPPMPEMISTAMSVLPPSLTPIIEPLLGELDGLVAQGPAALLEGLRELPARIADALAAYAPRALLEEPLGTPFAALVGELDGFSPTAWLDGADGALRGALDRLADALDPAALVAPLAQAHAALVQELSTLRPGKLLEPLTAQVEQALGDLDVALPTEDLAQALAQVTAQVSRLLEPFSQAADVIGAWTARLGLLADPDAQLSAWLDTILAKLPADLSAPLAPALAALCNAIEATGAAAMQTAWSTARAPLVGALDAAGGAARLAALVQARSALTPARIAAVSDAAQRTALGNFVDGLDLLGPVGRGLREFGALADALRETETDIAALLATWDARYLRADGPIASLVPASLDAATLRTLIRTALDRQLGAPVVGFLKALKAVGALITHFGDQISDLLEAIQARLAALLAAPQALADAAAALDGLVDRIAGLDLDLYTREVDALHGALLAKLRALDPANLAAALREALQDLLGEISLGGVFTPALRGQLDAAWAELKAQVAALDPEVLVIEPLQQVYEQDLLPVVQGFDVGDALDTVLGKLDALPGDLRTELDRVDAAYQAMLAAAPTSNPAGGSAAVGF